MKKHIQNLKGISILLVLLTIGCKSNSQQAATVDLPAKVINETEISWKSNFEEALAEAKSRGELLFVECYSPTCPYCLALEPFFKEPEVAKKYNSNFINFKLNVTEADQVKYLNERNIWLPSFPMFLYFDGDGNLVHQASADPNIASINGNADAALNPETRASSFSKRFKDGERSVEFLANYASFARVIKDTTAGINAAKALYEVYPKEKLSTEESWELTKKAVDDLDNGFAQHWFNHVNEAAAFEKEEGHADNQNNILGGILQRTLYGPKGKEFSIDELKKVRLYMSRIGASQYADNTLWEFETKANIREGNLPQALAVGNKMINTFKGNGSAYVYITRVFTDNFPDNSYVKSAKSWLVSALPTITQDNVRAEYYYELARLNQKDGETEKAKLNAKTAVDLATKIGTKLEKFNTLYTSLK